MVLFAFILSLTAPAMATAKTVAPVVTEAAIDVDSATIDDISLKLTLRAENRNSTDLKVEKVQADVKIDGLEGKFHVTSDKPVVLKARSATKYAMPLKLPWKSALFISGKVLGKEPIGYQIKGTARIGGKDVPFEHKGKLPAKS